MTQLIRSEMGIILTFARDTLQYLSALTICPVAGLGSGTTWAYEIGSKPALHQFVRDPQYSIGRFGYIVQVATLTNRGTEQSVSKVRTCISPVVRFVWRNQVQTTKTQPKNPKAFPMLLAWLLTFFVDEDSLSLARVLRALFPHATVIIAVDGQSSIKLSDPDEDWLPIVSARGWIIVTRDNRIFKDEEKSKHIDYGGFRMVLLTGFNNTDRKGLKWLLTANSEEIQQLASNLAPPWVFRVTKMTDEASPGYRTRICSPAELFEQYKKPRQGR